MATRDLMVAIVGSGGDGVITMGNMLAQLGAAYGLNVVKVEAYGPQIRGGEASCTVRICADPICSQGDRADVVVVFSWEAFSRFRGEIVVAPDAVILHEADGAGRPDDADLGSGPETTWVPLPLRAKAREVCGTELAKNILMLGLLSAVTGLPEQDLMRVIERRFAGRPEAVRESNRKGFAAGVELAASLPDTLASKRLAYSRGKPRMLVSGNQLAAVGAIHAGCRYFGGYPITPSSEILHFMSEWLPKVGGSVLQTEDELSAIGSVIGASFAGVKAMTCTSGPGLALMTEMLGLASIAEIPIVIVDVQRGGPSTGLPTKNEQSDLFQALWGSHGDAPRVVLAPSDVEDCFHATVRAFNVAERYQIPVIVLSDQNIAQRSQTLSMIDFDKEEVVGRHVPTLDELKDYKRYRLTPEGVSPMSFPGLRGGEYQTSGLEHDEHARPTSMHLMHQRMSSKRYRKLKQMRDRDRSFHIFGHEEAEIGILCWGSSSGPVREAVKRAVDRGERVAAFVPQMLYPFPKRPFEDFVRKVQEIIVVELSYSAQFYKYLRTFLELPEHRTRVYKRAGGRNLTVGEVEAVIAKVRPLTGLKKEILI